MHTTQYRIYFIIGNDTKNQKIHTEKEIRVHVFMERGELPQKVTITGKVKVKGRKKPTVYTNNPLY